MDVLHKTGHYFSQARRSVRPNPSVDDFHRIRLVEIGPLQVRYGWRLCHLRPSWKNDAPLAWPVKSIRSLRVEASATARTNPALHVFGHRLSTGAASVSENTDAVFCQAASTLTRSPDEPM